MFRWYGQLCNLADKPRCVHNKPWCCIWNCRTAVDGNESEIELKATSSIKTKVHVHRCKFPHKTVGSYGNRGPGPSAPGHESSGAKTPEAGAICLSEVQWCEFVHFYYAVICSQIYRKLLHSVWSHIIGYDTVTKCGKGVQKHESLEVYKVAGLEPSSLMEVYVNVHVSVLSISAPTIFRAVIIMHNWGVPHITCNHETGWPLSSHDQIPWLFPDFSRHFKSKFTEYRPS